MPFFLNKGSFKGNIKLAGKDEVLQGNKKIAEELNTLFNAVSSFDTNENYRIMNQNFQNIDHPVDRVIEMYKYHRSIILMNNKVDNQNRFSFELVALSVIVKQIKDIKPTKSSTKDSIPPKMLK